jgi:DNA-binding NarL/FixJ family response regulator
MLPAANEAAVPPERTREGQASRKRPQRGAFVSDQLDNKLVRLLLLHERGLFLTCLGRLLAGEPGFEVAGECGNAAEAMEILSASPVDIVLLDLELGTAHGSSFIPAARASGFRGRFLVLAETDDVERSAAALRLGASGVFIKTEAPDRLFEAIKLVASGAAWVDQKIIRFLADRWVTQPLRTADYRSGSPVGQREQNVLLGVLGGLTNKKIAINMGLSESSVKNTLQGLFAKAGVRTRSQLVRLALEGSLGNIRQLARRHAKAQMVGTPAPAAGRPR